MTQDRLEQAFAAGLAAAKAAGPHRAPPDGWPRFRLPPAVRATLLAAERLGACPDHVVDYYTRKMPALMLEQLFRAADDGARLLWRPLGETPRLDAALAGVRAALQRAGIAPSAVLREERATVAEIYAPSFFASGMPLLGAFPAEREVLRGDLAAGRDPDAVIDLRLSGNLVHELCHGLPRDSDEPPAPWTLIEAGALHLGMTARPSHIFPDVAGEAVPGVSLLALVGAGFARRFGERALWGLAAGGTLAGGFGAAAGPLAVAGWQAWLRRREPPFVADALDAEAWIKLGDLALAGIDCDDDPRRVPDLLGAAERTPWSALPWWHEEPAAMDCAMIPTAVRALFQVNVLAPSFQTWPAEVSGPLVLEVERCRLSAPVRANGVFAEPAWWIYPPSLCRRLWERGARRVEIAGATRARIDAIADALIALDAETTTLPATVELAWTSSR